MSEQSRRNFLKGAATGAVVASATGSTQAEAQPGPGGPPVAINPSAKALMPNGELATREQILKSLNMNPNTSPEAWLAILACGSNKAAAPDGAIIDALKNKTIQMNELSPEEVGRVQDTLKSLPTK